MHRVHLRRRTNILKMLVVHAGAANLGLLMRMLLGVGTPRALQGRLRAAFSLMIPVKRALQRPWPPLVVRRSRFHDQLVAHAPTACVSATS